MTSSKPSTFPSHGSDDQERKKLEEECKRLEAWVRQLTNLTNQKERHFRQIMASHELLSHQIDQRHQRSGQGFGEVLKMQMISEDARKEGHDQVVSLLGSILKELQAKDFVVVPEEERQYTFDPDEEL